MQLLPLKPAARMITTIGKDLIKDIPASIVELVKNSYDADAENVEIIFSKYLEGEEPRISITIRDDGHGMDLDTMTKAWLVPATPNKLNRKSKHKSRLLQGRKGIGRYAAAILGNYLQMETIHNNDKTIVYVNWDDFEELEYLEDVRVEVESIPVDEPNGTVIKIIGDTEYFNLWNEKELKKLVKELRKLLSPFQEDLARDTFKIEMKVIDFIENSTEFNNYSTIIEPLPIIDMYNYRLYGKIDNQGMAYLNYENNSLEVMQEEEIDPFYIDLGYEGGNYCGEIDIDFRVFDLDTANLSSLQQKLIKTVDLSFTQREVAKEVKEMAGVGIYRGGFRIRPHGDKGFDWLNLDGRRVQNPSLRIGVDQIIGYISIQPEEFSKLEEKSARDGLKENLYFEGLKTQSIEVLKILENKRFAFRRSTDHSKQKTIYQKMESLFDFTEFQHTVTKTIESKFDEVAQGKNKKEVEEEFFKVFNKSINAIKKEKAKEYEEIKQIIALYQGQATLGNITTTILHEGRKHTSWFSNSVPRVVEWLKEYRLEKTNELLDDSINRLERADKETQALIELFDKLDPLTTAKKETVKKINLSEIIDYMEGIFKGSLNDYNIKIIKEFEDNKIVWNGFEQDYRRVFANLFENSIYWLKRDTKNVNRYIKVLAEYSDNNLIIDIIDNGPGIKKEHIENNIIFTPGFSAKESGTGLGLAISGESIRRNEGKLKALYSTNGAHLRIELGGKAIE
ncbi:sensor histidine kinase [Bacillus sp. FSL L8-0199]|uniref:sensor histidine kinase n=1 Tax=Bacillus sp. FSL L8-0199 TaxID=2954616 RepID=UPI0030F8E240